MISENIISNLVENVHAGIVIINDNNKVVFTNSFIQQKIGFTEAELMGEGFFSLAFTDSESRARILDKIKITFSRPFQNFELILKKKDGETVPLRVSGSSFTSDDESYVNLLLNDETNQKAFQQVLEASYDSLQQTTIDLDEALTKIKEQQELLAEYKRKMDRELTIATSVQNTLIPSKFRSDSKISIWGVSVPSEELGGDYFDFFELEENVIGVLIADVVGHGVPAALIATMLKAYFEYYTKHFKEPGELFNQINRVMSEILEDTGLYLTAYYSIIDLNNMQIHSTSAGHDSALCFYSDIDMPVKLTTSAEANGTILGAFSEAEYTSASSRLKPGCRLVFFTDGITEARNEKEEFYGTEGLIRQINNNQDKTPEATVAALMGDINQFYGTKPPNDDRTIIIIDVLPDWHNLKIEKSKLDNIKLLIRKKEFSKAIETARILINQNENLTEAYILAGKTSILTGNYEEAKAFLDKAVVLDERVFKGFYYLGVANYNLKHFTEAKKCWHKVKALYGNYKNTDRFLEQLNRRTKEARKKAEEKQE